MPPSFSPADSSNNISIRLEVVVIFVTISCLAFISLRQTWRTWRAASSWRQFLKTGRREDLDSAIAFRRDVLLSFPRGFPYRGEQLHELALSLRMRYKRWGEIDDLESAIMLSQTSLQHRSWNHRDRRLKLRNLASCLRNRFKNEGRIIDLDEAISLERLALDLQHDGDSDRHRSLSSLATSLRTRFEHGGRIVDLEESISLYRTALGLRPAGHTGHSDSLAHLAGSLWLRFQHAGRIEDLEDAISMHRLALQFRTQGHPQRTFSLGSLAISIWTRFQHSGRVMDLEESISLGRAALELRPKGNPSRSDSLTTLAGCLCARYRLTRNIDDLVEAISMDREALELRPWGHPNHSSSLNNLAGSLLILFQDCGKVEDLDEAISLNRMAIVFGAESHPYRAALLGSLAMCLRTRFQYHGRREDLEEAISLQRNSLELRPQGHPDHSSFSASLAELLYSRFRKEHSVSDFEEAVQCFSRAALHTFSSIETRLDSVHRWVTVARLHDHSSLLGAHRTAMSLLQRALGIRPTLAEQHQFLCQDSRYQTFALEAASDAICKDELILAVEFLEQGRALLWSQMRAFRTPLEQLSQADGNLAARFGACNRRLEALTTWSALRANLPSTPESDLPTKQLSIDEMLLQMRRLSEEQETIINEIRQKPGFENFLIASPFSAIQQAALEGPVIVLNHSEVRCDALILLAHANDPCICVPLDKDFYADCVGLNKQLIRTRKNSGVSSSEYDEVLRRVMKVLWDRVVCKVVQKLKELGFNEGSRIWWCPTSVLTAFPFHAAGPYESTDGTARYLLDDYISSYTPTLASLINARSGTQSRGKAKMLFVGDTDLYSTTKEMRAISRVRRFKKLLDGDATPEAVLSRLQDVQWVHFTCHGVLAKEPFNSFLKLSGGGLTLLDIARANIPSAEFAFLSACHTAEQGADFALDEVLHLSAGMQFCGFRSVVGTMWQLLDHDGPDLASTVYKHLMCDLGKGEARFKRAAAAVRLAALNLRENGDVDPRTGKLMPERWVNLVHIGA